MIVEEIETLHSVNLGYFYWKYNNPKKNGFAAVARALLAQLLQQNLDLLPHLYEECISSGEVTLESLTLSRKLLRTILGSTDKTFIVIDGVDECDKGERKKILSWLKSIIVDINKENPGALRGLVISQDEGDIRKILSAAWTISLQPQDNWTDIQWYASYWSSKIQAKFDLPTAGGKEITSKISQRANG